MKVRLVRLMAAAAGVASIAMAPAAAAAAPRHATTGHATTTGSGGFNGPVVTHPGAPPRDYPAGEVCAFPMHVDFPVNEVVQSTWTDDAGAPVFAIATGALTVKVTNVATGRSVTRSADGTGNYSFPDPTSSVLTGSEFAAFLHRTDSPPGRALIFGKHDFAAVRVATVDGQTTRTVLYQKGHPEDLCRTLSH